MPKPIRSLLCLLALGAGLATAPPAAALACLDTDLYAEILERYTAPVSDTAQVRVDYAALQDASEWERLVDGLAGCDLGELDSREERLAFWINVYNILAIEIVQRNHPLESIRDVGSFWNPVWDHEVARVGSRPVSLGEIEHEILRPMGEARIHGAIVCASTSCPPLRREPYRAGTLDAQLDSAMRRWLADPRKGARLDRSSRTLHLSPIFDWFEEDFASRGGVLGFVRPYLPESMAEYVAEREDSLRIRHLDYDWRLNDLAASRPPRPARSERNASEVNRLEQAGLRGRRAASRRRAE